MPHIPILYQHYLVNPIISTDTRNISEGCIFFALKGENFNANTFAEKALQKGAALVVIDEEHYQINDRCILVPDVLIALQELAKYHRLQLKIPVIGLTGSNGKTTTKELLKAVLAEQFKTFATKGNLNNHIGVPLSILAITADTEIAVIEMGANHQREIALLCSIAQPTHGLITNIGMAHLDGFGGFEGVKKGKAELYAYLKQHAGIVFIYRNNPYLLEMSAAASLNKVIYYGTNMQDKVYGKLIKSDPFIALNWSSGGETTTAKANLTGAYNFENILAAICVGEFFGLSAAQINLGLANYFPQNNRSQLQKTAENTLICDFYNANPSSMEAALNNLTGLTAISKAAILGDMFELGKEAAEQHDLIAKKAAAAGFTTLIFIGKYFYTLKGKYAGEFFNTPKEACDYLTQNPIKNSLILLKGSRGMALEQLMPLL
ncbi:UDP-N-acetylmuramoyl-tripeptide--D-alanyl-D-alanine ligase [Pedobacter sp. CG_S7]|uniref:UDP-N-acetylmuramoyl-tripeptide--D-alanyl-D- alanine ligase n=1 Tax=Pedobacter sp. CG_S7 TaxID=3143930 RepID=UPI0033914178